MKCNNERKCVTFTYVERQDWTKETCYLKTEHCDEIDIIPAEKIWTFDKTDLNDTVKYVGGCRCLRALNE